MGTFEPILLPAEEAAKLLKVSRATVYRLIQKGELEKSKKDGGPSMVTLESVKAYQVSKMSIREIAERLVELERKVDFLMAQGPSNKPAGKKYSDLSKELRRRHPELFNT